MGSVTSRDGTEIAYTASGEGPAVVLIDGAFGYHAFGPNVGLAPLLADTFTAVLYDRRGRGDSGDLQPFEKRREIEDIDALIEGVGGSAHLYGSSSGAALAAEAASTLGAERVTRLALHEPSYILDDSHQPVRSDYLDQLRALLAEGRRGDMVALFLTDAVGLPAELVEGMKQSPIWTTMEGVAHTLVYDGAFMLENQQAKPMTEELRATLEALEMPTLVIDGDATFPFLSHTADTVARVIPDARRHTIEGEHHDIAPDAIAPVLTKFFTSA